MIFGLITPVASIYATPRTRGTLDIVDRYGCVYGRLGHQLGDTDKHERTPDHADTGATVACPRNACAQSRDHIQRIVSCGTLARPIMAPAPSVCPVYDCSTFLFAASLPVCLPIAICNQRTFQALPANGSLAWRFPLSISGAAKLPNRSAAGVWEFREADRQMWRTHSCVPRRHSCRRLAGGAKRRQLRSYYCVNP